MFFLFFRAIFGIWSCYTLPLALFHVLEIYAASCTMGEARHVEQTQKRRFFVARVLIETRFRILQYARWTCAILILTWLWPPRNGPRTTHARYSSLDTHKITNTLPLTYALGVTKISFSLATHIHTRARPTRLHNKTGRRTGSLCATADEKLCARLYRRGWEP